MYVLHEYERPKEYFYSSDVIHQKLTRHYSLSTEGI